MPPSNRNRDHRQIACILMKHYDDIINEILSLYPEDKYNYDLVPEKTYLKERLAFYGYDSEGIETMHRITGKPFEEIINSLQ